MPASCSRTLYTALAVTSLHSTPLIEGPVSYTHLDVYKRQHQALRITTKEDLASTLIALLQDSGAAKSMGERARKVFGQQAGATDRCVSALRELLAVADRERAS